MSVSRAKRALTSAAQAMGLANPAAAKFAPVAEQPSTADPDDGRVLARELFPSRFNPRRRFDEAALDSLGDSMCEHGQLQPLLVRPAKPPEGSDHPDAHLEIIAGERRWRAVCRKIEQGKWPADRPIAIKVRDMDDRTLLQLVAHEYYQREQLDEIEEAEYFELLRRDYALSEREVATFCGITERTVFRRRRLLSCEPEIKEALRKGEITVNMADAFASGERDRQLEGLSLFRQAPDEPWRRDPRRLREHMTRGLPMLSWARFDRSSYTGAIIDAAEGEEEGSGFFADVTQFRTLQETEIASLAGKLLADGWAFVERREPGQAYLEFDFGGEERDEAAGCIIEVPADLSRVTIRENYVRKPAADESSAAPAETPPRYITRNQLGIVRQAKTAALQDAVATDPQVALALLCLALLGGPEIMIQRAYHAERDDREPVRARIQELLPAGFEPFTHHASVAESGLAAANLQCLLDMPTEQLVDLVAALVARDVGAWHEGRTEIGDTPLVCAAAQALADGDSGPALPGPIPSGFVMDEAYLASYDKPGLFRLHQAAGVPVARRAAKKGEIVQDMLASPGLAALSAAAPEARFLSTEALTEELERLCPSKAPPSRTVTAEETEPRTEEESAGSAPAAELPAAPEQGIFIIRKHLPHAPAGDWLVAREVADLRDARADLATEITFDRNEGATAGTEWQLVREIEQNGKREIAQVIAHSRLEKKGKKLVLAILVADLDLDAAAAADASAIRADEEWR